MYWLFQGKGAWSIGASAAVVMAFAFLLLIVCAGMAYYKLRGRAAMQGRNTTNPADDAPLEQVVLVVPFSLCWSSFFVSCMVCTSFVIFTGTYDKVQE
jgi:heme/copper-type cytochrome/quinol oxidase subunit 2